MLRFLWRALLSGTICVGAPVGDLAGMGTCSEIATHPGLHALIPQDTLLPQDTLTPQDTLAPQDTLTAQDTTVAPADTVVRAFPTFPLPARLGPGTARSWTRHDLLMNGALTPGDLLEHAGPLDAVRAGFLEGPMAMVFAGSGPAGLRMEIDGYEMPPLDGGALDIHARSLIEMSEARLAREPGGYRLYTDNYRRERPQAYSRIDGGTGDRDTNMLRGFFASEFFETPLGFGFDRIDTDGVGELEGSERTAIWADISRRLPLVPGDVWGQVVFRNSSITRGSAESYQRRDWIFRIRPDLGEEWHADLVAGAARRELAEEEEPPEGEKPRVPRRITARQIAVRGAWTREGIRAFLTLRYWDGDPVPELEPEARIELEAGRARVYAMARYADWGDFDTMAGYVAARVRLPLGLQAMAELESGDQGRVRGRPVDQVGFDRWTIGGELRQLGWTLSVRGGLWQVEPSPGLDFPFDSLSTLPGDEVGVIEASLMGRIFTLFGGPLELGGSYRSRDPGAVLYWPENEWWLEGRYHTLLLDDELEIRLRALGGLRGSMRVVDPEVAPVTFPLSPELTWLWAEASVRIKDVYLYYNYEVFDAPAGPEDVPGFPLSRARTHFGLKWRFWN